MSYEPTNHDIEEMVAREMEARDEEDRAQAAQHADTLLWLQGGQEALDNSAWRPLTASERHSLAFLAHLTVKD